MLWILICLDPHRFCQLVLDQVGQNLPTKIEKVKKFHVGRGAEGFLLLGLLSRWPRDKNNEIFDNKKKQFFSSCKFLQYLIVETQDPDPKLFPDMK